MGESAMAECYHFLKNGVRQQGGGLAWTEEGLKIARLRHRILVIWMSMHVVISN